jgi:aspartate/glutamate racemase
MLVLYQKFNCLSRTIFGMYHYDTFLCVNFVFSKISNCVRAGERTGREKALSHNRPTLSSIIVYNI